MITHGHGHDHDHEHVSDGPHTHLTSVGIDIGSSTSHMMFSRLLVGYPSLFCRHPEVIEREVLHRSEVLLTPFSKEGVIESGPLSELVDSSFRQAGLTRDSVDTGAVILTGEAARRKNAQKIGELFSDAAGRFVCATAGPRLEAILAAHGSGTVMQSREWGRDFLNVDVGGGTTKVTLVRKGRIEGVMALNIGARLIAYDDHRRVIRVEDGGARFMEKLGCRVSPGGSISEGHVDQLAAAMASTLFQVIRDGRAPWEELMVAGSIGEPSGVDGVIFSGGVAEYVYGRERRSFGDLGPSLALELKRRARESGFEIVGSSEGLRATVIGASQYTIQMSGETISIPRAFDLPIRNLRVLPVTLSWDPPIADRSGAAVLESLNSIDPEVRGEPFVLALSCPEFIGYSSVQEMAKGIRSAMASLNEGARPKALIFNRNVGRVVGDVLGPGFPLPCIDEISLSELDFIDIGDVIPGEEFVPVVVKSLTFGV